MMRTVAGEIARGLEQLGATHVFGLIGEGNMVLANAVTDDAGLAFIGSRHESAAVGMADGYARATGRVGITSVTQGPGVTNTITALITAQNAQSSVMLFAPEVPESVQWHIQKLDLHSLATGAGLASVQLDLAAPHDAVVACHEWARKNQRPIMIRFPFPALEAGVNDTDVGSRVVLPATTAREATLPDESQLRGAEELLAKSEKPAILIGHGVRLSNAEHEIAALAEATGAIVATTLMGKGMLADHPQSVGLCGGFSQPRTHRLIHESDLVLVVGATLNQFTTHQGTILPSGEPVIHCDADAAHIGRITAVDVALVGDAKLTAAELTRRFLAENGPRDFTRSTDYRSEQVANLGTPTSEDLLNPERLMHELDSLLPQDRVVIVEGGHNMGFCARNLSARGSRNFFVPIEFGAIGSALGVGIGASFGQPEAFPVITIGDGSLLMNFGELETLCRYEVPCAVIVLDDGSYAAEYHALDLKGMSLKHSVYTHHDFAAGARSLGATARTLRRPEDLAELPAIVPSSLRGPLVLDCKIDLSIRGDWLDAVPH